MLASPELRLCKDGPAKGGSSGWCWAAALGADNVATGTAAAAAKGELPAASSVDRLLLEPEASTSIAVEGSSAILAKLASPSV